MNPRYNSDVHKYNGHVHCVFTTQCIISTKHQKLICTLNSQIRVCSLTGVCCLGKDNLLASSSSCFDRPSKYICLKFKSQASLKISCQLFNRYSLASELLEVFLLKCRQKRFNTEIPTHYYIPGSVWEKLFEGTDLSWMNYDCECVSVGAKRGKTPTKFESH